MLGDIKPTLSFNLFFNRDRHQPEIKFYTEHNKGKLLYFVKNISKYSAYQIHIYSYEDHYQEVALQFIAQAGDVLEPGETKKATSYIEYPFVGCMSYKEYWVEFSDAEGNHYRYSSGSDNSGIELANVKKLKKRTKHITTGIRKKNRIKTLLSSFMYKIRYLTKI
ncbi:hypothetical protein KBD09_00235 [Candidatus Woesebacteria bacterium]|nr:hypothetical protein [Candidatus Woesebacteria bacterium]